MFFISQLQLVYCFKSFRKKTQWPQNVFLSKVSRDLRWEKILRLCLYIWSQKRTNKIFKTSSHIQLLNLFIQSWISKKFHFFFNPWKFDLYFKIHFLGVNTVLYLKMIENSPKLSFTSPIFRTLGSWIISILCYQTLYKFNNLPLLIFDIS